MTISAYQGVCPTCLHDHSAPLASLASSGDHAELALNAKAAQTWALGIYENRDQAARRSKFIDSDLPATVLALIAEAAALRGENAALREHRITADLLVSTIKADKEEAERKLAEAVAVIERLGSSEAFDMPRVIDGPLAAEMRARMDFARTFLSKEAERG